MEEAYVMEKTCETQHEAVVDKFKVVHNRIDGEITDRKDADQETKKKLDGVVADMKAEFEKTNKKIDTAVDVIRDNWFKNIFALVKLLASIIAMGGLWILERALSGNLNF